MSQTRTIPGPWDDAFTPPEDSPCLDTSFHDHEMDLGDDDEDYGGDLPNSRA